MELAIGMEMPGFLLLSTICRQKVAQLIATLHHQLLARRKPLHRHHTTAAGASLHLHHGKGTLLDFQEHHIIDTHLHQSRVGNVHIPLCPAINVHIKAAELAGTCIGRKRVRSEENLAGLLFRVHLLSHAPGTLHHLLGAAIQASGSDARELRHIIAIQRALNLHTTQVAHGDYRCTLLTPTALGSAHIAHNTIIISTHHQGGHAVLRRNFGAHHQNLEICLSHLQFALKLTLLCILEVKLFLQVTAGGAGRFEALQALADGIDFLATAGNGGLLLPGFGHQGTHFRSNHRVKNLTLLHALSRFDTQRNAAGTGQRIGFLSMARHCQIAIQAMLQSKSHSRHFLNLHGRNVAGMGISRHQNRGSPTATGAVVMRTTGAMFMLMLSLGGVVMRAAFAVLMLMLSFGSVVVRAAFAVFVLVLSFGSVVVCAAFAVFMLVLSFGGVVVCAAFAVLMLVLGFGGMVVCAALAVFVLVLSFSSVVVCAPLAMFVLVLGFGSVVVCAALAVFVLVLSFGSVVVCAAFAVFVLVLSLGGMVMRADFAVFVLVLGFGSVVVRAAFAMFMLGFGLCSMVVRAALAVFMRVLSLGGVVMRAGFTMLMLMAGFSRIHGRIRQSGNKA